MRDRKWANRFICGGRFSAARAIPTMAIVESVSPVAPATTKFFLTPPFSAVLLPERWATDVDGSIARRANAIHHCSALSPVGCFDLQGELHLTTNPTDPAILQP